MSFLPTSVGTVKPILAYERNGSNCELLLNLYQFFLKLSWKYSSLCLVALFTQISVLFVGRSHIISLHVL
jgi:hypothetical protein